MRMMPRLQRNARALSSGTAADTLVKSPSMGMSAEIGRPAYGRLDDRRARRRFRLTRSAAAFD